MSTLERIWFAYLAAVLAVALATDGGGAAGHRPWLFAAVHLAVLLAWLACGLHSARLGDRRARVLRSALTLVCLPVVFSSLAWLLPHVHPEPYEYLWFLVDRALFGVDASQWLHAAVPRWLELLLQLDYAAFYWLPIAAALCVLRAAGPPAYDRTLAILTGGFLASYLGYLLFPTLAPKVVLPDGGGVGGDGLAGVLHGWIDLAEANPWDCFPSGHTWLSVTSLLVVGRWAPRYLPWFLAVALPLIASTMILRYHWPIDVAAGALLAWPAMRLCELLFDRDQQTAASRHAPAAAAEPAGT